MALIIDIIEGFTAIPDTQSKFIGLVPPAISGDDEVYISDDVSFVASGSVSAFGTSIEYTWILPDGSIFVGGTLNFHVPEDTKHGSTIGIKCFAKDTFNNESTQTLKLITAYDINMPVINTISWNDNNHFENNSYILTIDATDPNSLDIIYEVVCNDDTVGIIQRTGAEEHIFDIVYGTYAKVTNIEFTITVINTNDLFDILIESIDVHYEKKDPIINNIYWNDNYHYENMSYVITIEAIDLNDLDLTYEVTCNDGSVGIVQRAEDEEHIFDITYGEHDDNSDIEYTITVTNTDSLTDIETKIITIHNIDPIVNTIYWNDDDHFENHSYILTIDAVDAEGLDLTYEVACDDATVVIVQQGFPNEHIFDITYGEYTSDTNIEYTITVTNTNNDSTIKHESIIIHDTDPVINSVDWNDDDHYENNSYIMNINAIDPQSLELTYEVMCDNDTVEVVQQGSPNEHMFDITYGEYSDDTNISYTITVTNTESLFDIEIIDMIIQNVSLSRGIFAGGQGIVYEDTIEYITISTPGDTTDFGDLSVGKSFVGATSNGTNDRGVFAGGRDATNVIYDTIEYITISTIGDVTDFGDLTTTIRGAAATSNTTNERGIFAGGYVPGVGLFNKIEYITISTIGDGTEFGNLSTSKMTLSATSNSTNDRGIFAGGYTSTANTNTIEYITISTIGNVTNFGDLSTIKQALAATSNGIYDRGIFAGGINGSTNYNEIEYITISTTGNVTDFGDLSVARRYLAATSSGINDRGVFAGGKSGSSFVDIIEYITISTIGDAAEFGNLSVINSYLSATSDA